MSSSKLSNPITQSWQNVGGNSTWKWIHKLHRLLPELATDRTRPLFLTITRQISSAATPEARPKNAELSESNYYRNHRHRGQKAIIADVRLRFKWLNAVINHMISLLQIRMIVSCSPNESGILQFAIKHQSLSSGFRHAPSLHAASWTDFNNTQ